MSDNWLLPLMLTAATVGALHSLAPDHWVPFAALARARNWNSRRTARLTFLCGFGHVTVSALLGIIGLFVGLRTVEAFGSTLEANASLLLIGFGIAYMLWGLWRSFGGKLIHHAQHLDGVPHDHGHGHHHHRHEGKGLTEWSLFLLFCADPCVAVIPLIIAASAGGWTSIAQVVIVYELATIGAMIGLVSAAHAGVSVIRFGAWFERYGDALAGGLIVVLGTLVTVLGI